jgi:hypothetical protein
MKIQKNHALLSAVSLILVALIVSDANGVSDTETFTVTAEAVLTVTAPAASAGITHAQTDANQAFTPQSWTVAQNGAEGASITFSTDQAFTHATETTFKRDAKLDLALASSDTGSGWAVTVASDQTDYANATPDEVATVSADSTAPGDAAFNLTVTFVETDFSTLASGNYSTTITATITSN